MTRHATAYAFTCPSGDGSHRRLISRGTLDVIKLLREEGAQVAILPEDGSPLDYYVEKGEVDLLREVLYLVLVDIPIGVLTSLIGSWLFQRMGKKQKDLPEESHIAIGIEADGRRVFYDHRGREVPQETVNQLIELVKDRASTLTAISTARSPYPDLPIPICLEHTERIVGWGKPVETERGLKLEPGKITDQETWLRIQNGELRGMSIAAVVCDSECSICHRQYVECEHVSGLQYGGRVCVNSIKNTWRLIEVSIVKEPINSDCITPFASKRRRRAPRKSRKI